MIWQSIKWNAPTKKKWSYCLPEAMRTMKIEKETSLWSSGLVKVIILGVGCSINGLLKF